MKRGLAHNLQFNEGNNAESFLSVIAETHLWLGEFNAALSLYTALIRNEPDNIWHYNSIALTFCKGGLSELGILATQRAQRLIETVGDPERLADQFRDSLARLEACTEPDQQSKLEPTILSDFSDSLSLAFDAGRDVPYPMLARELFSRSGLIAREGSSRNADIAAFTPIYHSRETSHCTLACARNPSLPCPGKKSR